MTRITSAAASLALLALTGCPSGGADAPAGVSEAEAPAEGTSETAGEAEPPAAEPEAPAPEAAAATIPDAARQPCTITVAAEEDAENGCFEVPHLQVAGLAQMVCVRAEEPYTFSYDDQGRLLTDGWRTFTYAADGTATVAGHADEPWPVRFDDSGRVAAYGESAYTWDELGRLSRVEEGDRFLAYAYAADGTYTTTHNYPDTDEFCVADRTAVEGPVEQPTMERYAHCEINEMPRTLRYTWDEHGRITSFTIDAFNDDTVDATATVSYACHG